MYDDATRRLDKARILVNSICVHGYSCNCLLNSEQTLIKYSNKTSAQTRTVFTVYKCSTSETIEFKLQNNI